MRPKPLRVLFVLPSLKRGGAETQLVNLVSKMDPGRIEAHVLTFERHLDQLERLREAGIEHHYQRRGSKYDFSYTAEIARLVDELEIDVLHSTLQFALLAGWLGRLRARRAPPIVAAIHTTISRDRKEEFQVRLLYRWLLRGCARIVFVCRAQQAYWVERYPGLKERSIVIYNGIDPDRFQRTGGSDLEAEALRAQLGIGSGEIVIAAVAGFRPEKRYDLLLDAFQRLPGNMRLLLAGDGPMRQEVESRVKVAGLDHRVHFLGLVSDTRPVLAASSVSLLSSTAVETFSMAVLESMAMEVPVIVPDLSGLPEAVEHGETGFIYPTGSVDGLSGALAAFAELPARRRREMGQAARRRVVNNFAEQRMVKETEDLLCTVAADGFAG